MGNIVGRGSPISLFYFMVRSIWWFIRGIIGIFVLLIILFLLTEDFYDYTSWDIPLISQLLAFLVLLFGLIYSFFKPKISGYIILFSSIVFWLVTALFRNQFWLGSIYLVFPLIGLLLILVSKVNLPKQKDRGKTVKVRKSK